MNTVSKGRLGEQLAGVYLEKAGYTICATNYRYGRGEIDIITQKQGVLHFVEVKYRKTTAFGYPEEAVSEKKAAQVREAAEHYIFSSDWKQEIQFDILAILQRGNTLEYRLFEDAF